MTAYVLTAGGQRWQLPPALSWEVEYTCGVPCDSFFYSCPCMGTGGADTAQWYRTEFYEGDELVFRGVVDECVQTVSSTGHRLELTGRGMAALLLDNEALPQDYETADLQDILRDHVSPYGIETAGSPALPRVNHFSVASGSSEWAVLYEFARYCGGISPRFDRQGQLVLDPWPEGRILLLGDGTAVTELSIRDQRYGALSQVWVRDRYRDHTEKVSDQRFIDQGGCARRVITMPGRSDWQTMRHTGKYQLERSAAQRLRLEVEIPQLFWAAPGELVQVQRSDFDRNGLYRVDTAAVRTDSSGGRTRLELAVPDAVGR